MALRDRLVAIYETGTPDVLSVIVGANGYDDLIDRTEYLNRIHGMDEAVVGRVRDLRDQVRRTVTRLRTAKNPIEAARDTIAAEEQALASARAAVQQRQSALVSARSERLAALQKIRKHEEELRRLGGRDPGQDRGATGGPGWCRLPGGADPGRQRQRPDLAGRRPGRLRFGSRSINGAYENHPGIDIAVPSGTPIQAAADGRGHHKPEATSGGYGNYTCIDHGGSLSTCYAHQGRSRFPPGRTVKRAR